MSLQQMFMALSAAAAAGVPGWVSMPSSVVDIQIAPDDSLAGIEIDVDGGIEGFKLSGNIGDIGRWDDNNALTKSDYQFRADETAGSFTEGDTPNAWLAASGSLDTWACRETGFGSSDCTFTLRVRLAVAPFTEYASVAGNLVYAESSP